MYPLIGTLKAVLGEFLPPSADSLAPGGQTAMLETLTVVVDDLTVASAALAAYLGQPGSAVEPWELDEAGLAQSFDVGPCHLLVMEPGSGTDAEEFLYTHGPGLYHLAVRNAVPDGARPARLSPAIAPLRAS